MEGDVMLYVVGGGEENEILLFGVVLALRDSLSILLKSVAAFSFSLQQDVPFLLSFPFYYFFRAAAANSCSALFLLVAGIRQTNALL